MNPDRLLFVTGMFRSGTTLIARMLASHPALAFASDPYAPLFKAIRNAVAARRAVESFNEDAPLDDYYFDADKLALLDAVRGVDLTSLAVFDDLASLRGRIAGHGRAYSPLIAPLLDRLEGDSFAELIASGLRLVAEAYGHGGEKAVGIKEVWTGEFVWPLLAGFADARAIVVVRDPRAVAASKNVRNEKYPWLFLARQWRKLTALAWLAAHDPGLCGRVRLIRYEDLVERPEESIRDLCQSADIAYEHRLTNPDQYRDGKGEPWFQNSSHFSQIQGFNTGSMTRWRGVLDEDQTRFVEAICWPEMLLLGYPLERFDPERFDERPFERPPLVENGELALWIRPYANNDTRMVREEMIWERRRFELLTARAQPTDEELRLCLLDPRLHRPLKNAMDHGVH